MFRLVPPPTGAAHSSEVFQTWYSLITKYINQLFTTVIPAPYAPGSFSIPTGYFATMSNTLILTGSQRVTITGTGRLRID